MDNETAVDINVTISYMDKDYSRRVLMELQDECETFIKKMLGFCPAKDHHPETLEKLDHE